MYDQIREDTLYILLYGMVTATAVIASCYLLFRRANAIVPDVTPPVRLRRWTGVFFASIALNLRGICQYSFSIQAMKSRPSTLLAVCLTA